MKKIEIIYKENEIQFAKLTNDYLNHDEMSKIKGGGIFCTSKKTCDDYVGDGSKCKRFKCGAYTYQQLTSIS